MRGQVGFLEPEPGDAVFGGEAELAIDELEQSRAGDGVGLINFVANLREVRAARDEFRAGVKCAGTRGGVLKRAGVGGNGGEQQVRNGLGDRPTRTLSRRENQFAVEASRAEIQFTSA